MGARHEMFTDHFAKTAAVHKGYLNLTKKFNKDEQTTDVSNLRYHPHY